MFNSISPENIPTSIQLLKPRVLALELRHEGFHLLYHREDLDTKGQFS